MTVKVRRKQHCCAAGNLWRAIDALLPPRKRLGTRRHAWRVETALIRLIILLCIVWHGFLQLWLRLLLVVLLPLFLCVRAGFSLWLKNHFHGLDQLACDGEERLALLLQGLEAIHDVRAWRGLLWLLRLLVEEIWVLTQDLGQWGQSWWLERFVC